MNRLIVHPSKAEAIAYSGMMANLIRARQYRMPPGWRGPVSSYYEDEVLYAVPSLIQGTLDNYSAGASSIALAFGTQPGGTNLLACFGCSTTSSVTFTVADSVNGAYNDDVFNSTGTANGIWTFPNCSGAGGAPTVTLTGSFSAGIYMIIEEWGGVLATSPLDQTGTNDGLTVSSFTVSTGGATTQAVELCLVSVGTVGSRSVTGTGGYTKDTSADGFLAALYNITSSTGVQTATGTFASTTYGAALATYKAATSGGANVAWLK
jgi:hypothetical protein